ncbi:MAG: MgtC/SapB family protein, partial [Actinomycetota bacterium]
MPEELTLSFWELLLRIAVAGALGGLIGLERELGDQPAGFRTHILVSLGSALFTLGGAYGVAPFIGVGLGVRFDPTRVASQIVTGIGFLGAGAILRQGFTVRGLTTAAALWVTAAIGMAAGLGYWWGAVLTTIATVVSLYGLKLVERPLVRRWMRGRHRYVLEVEPELRLSDLARVVEARSIRTERINLISGDEDRRTLVAVLRLPSTVSAEEVAQEISELPGVSSV